METLPSYVCSFRVCGEGEVQHEDIAPGGITGNQAGAIWISARVPTDCPVGTYLYEFSVFDQKGHQSNTLEATLYIDDLDRDRTIAEAFAADRRNAELRVDYRVRPRMYYSTIRPQTSESFRAPGTGYALHRARYEVSSTCG